MRGLTSTNYNIQSLDDIKKDLINWQNTIEKDIRQSNHIIEELNSDIWKNISEFDRFRHCAMQCYVFLQSSLKEISMVNNEINQFVSDKHIKLLRHMGDVSVNLYRDIGIAKHQGDRGYIEDLEMDLYGILRQMVFEMNDLQSLSDRLKDFVGENNVEFNWNKEGAIWSKRNAIIATIGIIVTVIISIFITKNSVLNITNEKKQNNILKENSIQAEQVIINNNGIVNTTNKKQ